VALTHQLVREVFSRQVITPGVTTLDDLTWWIRERLAGMKLTTWFQPLFYIIRPGSSDPAQSRVIGPGDLLRCDIGVTYMGLCSDVQETAYVLREGESDAPRGLRDAFARGNRLQDILAGEFKEGRTGNEILAAALKKAGSEGLGAVIYSHPVGYNGHGAGPRIGLSDMQDGVPGIGDYPLHLNTVYAIELGVQAKIPEWNDMSFHMALEEDGAFTSGGVTFLDGRQTRIILIK
jgi:Xaa-Pro aminopeptidase